MARVTLVLGGGGLVGIGWELGVVEGLREGGVDLHDADMTIGTSAGSIVGAVLEAGMSISELPERAAEVGPELQALTETVDRARVEAVSELWQAAGMRPTAAQRAEIAALGAGAPTASAEQYLDVMNRLLPVSEWPRGLIVTAVRVEDGELLAWDSSSGVPIASAIAASCAVPGVFPPVPLDGHRYVDGGIRSPSNLDLAAGTDIALLVVPSDRQSLGPALVEESAEIVGRGGRVVEILPEGPGMDAIGPNLMDMERVLGAAMAGYEQGRASAAEVGAALD